MRSLALLISLFLTGAAYAQETNRYSIEIDLQDQLAYLLDAGQVVLTLSRE